MQTCLMVTLSAMAMKSCVMGSIRSKVVQQTDTCTNIAVLFIPEINTCDRTPPHIYHNTVKSFLFGNNYI